MSTVRCLRRFSRQSLSRSATDGACSPLRSLRSAVTNMPNSILGDHQRVLGRLLGLLESEPAPAPASKLQASLIFTIIINSALCSTLA